MPAKQTTVKLASGYEMPQVGLGTWMSKAGKVKEATKVALKNGYRHIDTAHCYGNHVEIGEAIKESIAEGVVKREDVFVTSKVWNTHHSRNLVSVSVDIILSELQLDYVDLVLIHWPFGFKEGGDLFPVKEDGTFEYSDVDYLDTWKGLQDVVKNTKKVRSAGVSNFNIDQLKRVIEADGDVKCSINQVEIHPYLQQPELIKFCRANNIHVTGYCPLANNAHMSRKDGDRNLLTDAKVVDIGKAHTKSAAQVVIRWFIQKGLVVIPKSVTPSRVIQNFIVFDFTLTDAEMATIETLGAANWRITAWEEQKVHPHYPFH